MSDYEPDWTQEKAPNAIGGRVVPPATAAPEEPDEVPTIRDPHHDGYTTWKYESGRFWNRPHEGAKWREVKRIHATPARILVLASLVNSPPAAAGPKPPVREAELQGVASDIADGFDLTAAQVMMIYDAMRSAIEKHAAAPPQESGRGMRTNDATFNP